MIEKDEVNNNAKKILFLGDFFYDYDYVADDIKKISKWVKENNYVTILNLEGCFFKRDAEPIKKRGPNLASSKVAIEVLKELNTIAVCLANNHSMDFGGECLEDTIKLLEENNIHHIGAGRNIYDATKPYFITLNNEKIAILNFGWDVEESVYADFHKAGCAPREEKVVLSSIINARKNADKVIVCMHWGFEYNRLPMPFDIDLGHKMIDLGVELVIGHHPHNVQPKEIYKKKMIYYSLGNFYFSSDRSGFTKKFDEEITNQSDYGLMVGYDNLERNINEHLIFFNVESNKSEIIPSNEFILKDISNIDFNSQEYLRKVKKNKKNYNPILTLSKYKNNVKLTILYLNYKLRKIIKSIIRLV